MEDSELRSKFRGIGCKAEIGLHPQTIQCDFYAEFMRRRFPNETGNYALDWARRFARGEQFHYADKESKRILFEIMVEGTGDGNAPHLTKEDLKSLS